MVVDVVEVLVRVVDLSGESCDEVVVVEELLDDVDVAALAPEDELVKDETEVSSGQT